MEKNEDLEVKLMDLQRENSRLDERLLGLEAKYHALNVRTQGLEIIGGAPIQQRHTLNPWNTTTSEIVDAEYTE